MYLLKQNGCLLHECSTVFGKFLLQVSCSQEAVSLGLWTVTTTLTRSPSICVRAVRVAGTGSVNVTAMSCTMAPLEHLDVLLKVCQAYNGKL